jgi:hypothetical protein
MEEVSPVIARETTMWKAWVGFNGYGAILFGATVMEAAVSAYGGLVLVPPSVLPETIGASSR